MYLFDLLPVKLIEKKVKTININKYILSKKKKNEDMH